MHALALVLRESIPLRELIASLAAAESTLDASTNALNVSSSSSVAGVRLIAMLLVAPVRQLHQCAASTFELLRRTPIAHAESDALLQLLPLLASLALLAERAWRLADNAFRVVELAHTVRGVESFGALVDRTRTLLLDVRLVGRYADASGERRRKQRDVRLLLFSDALLWCKCELDASIAKARISAARLVARAAPLVASDVADRYPFELAEGAAPAQLRCLATSASQRSEILSAIGFIKSRSVA